MLPHYHFHHRSLSLPPSSTFVVAATHRCFLWLQADSTAHYHRPRYPLLLLTTPLCSIAYLHSHSISLSPTLTNHPIIYLIISTIMSLLLPAAVHHRRHYCCHPHSCLCHYRRPLSLPTTATVAHYCCRYRRPLPPRPNVIAHIRVITTTADHCRHLPVPPLPTIIAATTGRCHHDPMSLLLIAAHDC